MHSSRMFEIVVLDNAVWRYYLAKDIYSAEVLFNALTKEFPLVHMLNPKKDVIRDYNAF